MINTRISDDEKTGLAESGLVLVSKSTRGVTTSHSSSATVSSELRISFESCCFVEEKSFDVKSTDFFKISEIDSLKVTLRMARCPWGLPEIQATSAGLSMEAIARAAIMSFSQVLPTLMMWFWLWLTA